MKNKGTHSINALKMKEDIGKAFYKEFIVNGEFDSEKFRQARRKTIQEGRSSMYSTIEEYEKILRKAKHSSKSAIS